MTACHRAVASPVMTGPTEVYVEAGDKRAFAGAIEWPGWCRTGRREDDALDGLLAYGPLRARARRVVRGFTVPRSARSHRGRRLPGTPRPTSGLHRWRRRPIAAARRPGPEAVLAILDASWGAFDGSPRPPPARSCAKGRAGRRELDGIVDHVIGAESSTWQAGGARPKVEGRDRARLPTKSGRWSASAVSRGHGGPSGHGTSRRVDLAAALLRPPRRAGTCSITRGRSRIAIDG